MGALPVEGSDEQKRTNEIGMAIPLLDTCDITGKDITGDALLTQRAIATHVVGQQAHYHFTVKGNQPTLESDIALLFNSRGVPDYTELSHPITDVSKHGVFGAAQNSMPTSTSPTSGKFS